MGLTIHYNLKSAAATAQEAKELVETMRQLARELPFQEVDDAFVDLEGKQCNHEARRAELQSGTEKQQELFWFLIQAGLSFKCPWNSRIFLRGHPTHILGFKVFPGAGCEPANIGLAQFPATIPVIYEPRDDQRFEETIREGCSTTWQFSHRKWDRWCRKNGVRYGFPDDKRFQEIRMVPTRVAGWSWSSFCKTQYASDPDCGGLPNFLRCHISLITLLDRIAKLPGMKVQLNDEGKYGRSCYTDDPSAKKPVYTWHPGRYSPSALANEVGSWNEMMAAAFGAFQGIAGTAGLKMDAPILSYQNLEGLEFRGRRRKEIQPFLRAMTALVENQATKG